MVKIISLNKFAKPGLKKLYARGVSRMNTNLFALPTRQISTQPRSYERLGRIDTPELAILQICGTASVPHRTRCMKEELQAIQTDTLQARLSELRRYL